MTVAATSRLRAAILVTASIFLAACSTAGQPPESGKPDVSGSATTTALASPGLLAPCPPPSPTRPIELPRLSLDCLSGGPQVDLHGLSNGAYVINLWASWCAPCRKETPVLKAAAEAYPNIHFLGIDTADDNERAAAYLASAGLHYAQLGDPKSMLLHALGAPGLPLTVIIDAQGKRVYYRNGELKSAAFSTALASTTTR